MCAATSRKTRKRQLTWQTTRRPGCGRHRYGDGVLCEFRPRAEYKGRAIKPGIAEKAGTRFVLRTMWLMGDEDSYPGEYALSTVDSCGGLMEALGIAWVASGDVVVLPNKN